jgi:hypothetical protein
MKELISLVKELINNEENMFFPSAIESGGGRGSTNFEKWREKAIAALAELEKPAAHGPIYVPDAWEKEVDRIAESYHAKKCVHCQKIVYCELCGDPIMVGVCENCVPEIITDDGLFHSSDIVKFRKKLDSDIDEIIKKEPEPPHA